ncbi:MAG: hypothetical protein ABI875_02335, partial [Gemmatimonadales bacterium]
MSVVALAMILFLPQGLSAQLSVSGIRISGISVPRIIRTVRDVADARDAVVTRGSTQKRARAAVATGRQYV